MRALAQPLKVWYTQMWTISVRYKSTKRGSIVCDEAATDRTESRFAPTNNFKNIEKLICNCELTNLKFADFF